MTQELLRITQDTRLKVKPSSNLELLWKLLKITQENSAYSAFLRTTQNYLAEIKLLGKIPAYLGNYLELLRNYLGNSLGNYSELLKNLLRTTQNYLEPLRKLLRTTQESTQNYLGNYLELLRSTQNYLENYLG